jgi:hypothetical protein
MWSRLLMLKNRFIIHWKKKKKGCPALQLENREHKVVFTGGVVLDSVFEREFKGVFSIIRGGIIVRWNTSIRI